MSTAPLTITFSLTGTVVVWISTLGIGEQQSLSLCRSPEANNGITSYLNRG